MGDFPNVLKTLRLRDNLTQEDLSKLLLISKSAISMYENGNREPDFETLEKIADFFNVDMNYLLGRTNRTTHIVTNKKQYEPNYDDIQSLIARNGKKLTIEQKQDIIRTLLSDD